MRLTEFLRPLYGRLRLRHAEQRALRRELRQLRDTGLCGPSDLPALIDGTHARDPMRRQRRATMMHVPMPVAWVKRARPGLPRRA